MIWVSTQLLFNNFSTTTFPDALYSQWHVGVKDITVKDLLNELYDRGCERGLWWLVRHTSGLLKRTAVDLG